MHLVSPIGVAVVAAKRLASRQASLAGCRIAVLDNSKPNADALLVGVAERLADVTGARSIRVWRKPGASHPAANHDEIAAAADVVLTGSAD